MYRSAIEAIVEPNAEAGTEELAVEVAAAVAVRVVLREVVVRAVVVTTGLGAGAGLENAVTSPSRARSTSLATTTVGESESEASAVSDKVVAPTSGVASSWDSGAADAVVATMVRTMPDDAATSAPRRAVVEDAAMASPEIGVRRGARCFARSIVVVTWSLSLPIRGELSGSGGGCCPGLSTFTPRACARCGSPVPVIGLFVPRLHRQD